MYVFNYKISQDKGDESQILETRIMNHCLRKTHLKIYFIICLLDRQVLDISSIQYVLHLVYFKLFIFRYVPINH